MYLSRGLYTFQKNMCYEWSTAGVTHVWALLLSFFTTSQEPPREEKEKLTLHPPANDHRVWMVVIHVKVLLKYSYTRSFAHSYLISSTFSPSDDQRRHNRQQHPWCGLSMCCPSIRPSGFKHTRTQGAEHKFLSRLYYGYIYSHSTSLNISTDEYNLKYLSWSQIDQTFQNFIQVCKSLPKNFKRIISFPTRFESRARAKGEKPFC